MSSFGELVRFGVGR